MNMDTQYIAMNRFDVHAGRETDFEETWRKRDRYLGEVEGFLSFQLLRGETQAGITPFLSHSTWASQAHFRAWTRSEAFRKAHGDARTPKGTLAGHPVFSGYEVVLAQ